jgi:hypothetical protein
MASQAFIKGMHILSPAAVLLDHNNDKRSHLVFVSQRFPASSKFRDVFEQIEDEFWGSSLMRNLLTASSFRDSDVRYRRYLETEFRQTPMWCDPGAPHSWRNSNRLKLISFLTFKPTAGYREQVKELVMQAL